MHYGLELAEPSAAASLAGLLRLRDEGHIHHDEQVVLLVTGSGPKAVDVLLTGMERPASILPTIHAVRAQPGVIDGPV